MRRIRMCDISGWKNKRIMNAYLSDKIRVISFLSIILVLYIHSGFHDYPNEIQGMAFNATLQQAISGMIARCAVPMFFAISGYLYFRNIENRGQLWQKMRKRSRTLVVPYLIACLFPALFALAMETMPWTKAFMNGTGFSENFTKPWYNLLYMLYVDAGNGSPYAFHLWFLRDLIVIVALSPLLYLLKEKAGLKITLLLLFVLNYVGLPHNPTYGLFWFVFGAWFIPAMKNYPPRLTFINILIFIGLCAIEMVFPSPLWQYLQIPIIVVGLSSMWMLYDAVVAKDFSLKSHSLLGVACGFTFFIYLYHEPTLNVVRKILVMPLGHSSASFALSYLLSPWIYAAIAIVIGKCFKALLPKIYALLMGGR